MDVEICVSKLKVDDLRLLVLIDPHGEYEGTLGMGLSPLLVFSVIESKTNDTLSELVHNIDPEKKVNLMILKSENFVYLWEGTQVKTASISTALFITC